MKMGLGRWFLTGNWSRPLRKPTFREYLFLGDRDNIRRPFSQDEILAVGYKSRGFLGFGGPRCKSCGSQSNLHIDHKVPLFRGGFNSKRNLQLLCRSCNLRKATKIWW